MCWSPRLGGGMRVERDGYEHVARCRDCPGCREFERRRLADRLHAKHGRQTQAQPHSGRPGAAKHGAGDEESGNRLFLVRVYAPLEQHARLSHKIHRWLDAAVEPGFYRLGTSSFGLLASSPIAAPQRLRARGIECRVEPIRLRRGRRAWRAITAGALVARAAYGEQVNRWYARGLPPAEKLTWAIQRVKPYQSYRRLTSPRAWSDRRVVLVPPEIWQMGRADRRQIRTMLRNAKSPEAVGVAMTFVRELVAKVGKPIPVIAPAQPALSPEQVRAWYRRAADSIAAESARTASPSSDRPLTEGGGYASSDHSSGAPPPHPPPEESSPAPQTGELSWTERSRKDRIARGEQRRADKAGKASKFADDWLARMLKRVRGGETE